MASEIRPSVSIVVPTLARTGQLLGLLANIRETTRGRGGVEAVVVTEDEQTHAALGGLLRRTPLDVTTLRAGGTPVDKWNLGAAQASGDWLVLVGDDCLFKPGWLDAVEHTPNAGFVGLNEGVDWTDDVGHYCVSREFCRDVLGGVLAQPCYKSWSFDIEACALARAAGRYAKTRPVVLEHNHYSLGRARMDATYERALPWHVEDARVFVDRKAAGFPVTWQPVLGARHENVG